MKSKDKYLITCSSLWKEQHRDLRLDNMKQREEEVIVFTHEKHKEGSLDAPVVPSTKHSTRHIMHSHAKKSCNVIPVLHFLV